MEQKSNAWGKQSSVWVKRSENSSWKSDERLSFYGYKLIRQTEHPFCNSDGFVFEHRLLAERHLLNYENSVEINGIKYLKSDYVVHHIDFNKLNNNISDLEIMLKSKHTAYHNKLSVRERDLLGRYM